MAKIQIFFAGELQREYSLNDQYELKIGRDTDCDIVLDSVAISRHHCTLREVARKWYLVDEGSANGSFVNGERVSEHGLKHNDRVVFGKHTLVFDQLGCGRDPRRQKPSMRGLMDDQTMRMSSTALDAALERSQKQLMALVIHGPQRQVIPLTQDVTVIGKSHSADLTIKGLFVREQQAIVIKSNFGYRIVHSGGLRPLRVNGDKRDEVYLWAGDVITIAGNKISYGSL